MSFLLRPLNRVNTNDYSSLFVGHRAAATLIHDDDDPITSAHLGNPLGEAMREDVTALDLLTLVVNNSLRHCFFKTLLMQNECNQRNGW
jgi:hypothetical protein